MAFVPILSGVIGFIATLILLGIILYLSRDKGKIPITPNAPKIENPCRQQFTDGYYSGLLKLPIRHRPNGVSLVEFYPDDVEQGEDVPRPPLQSVCIRTELIRRGTFAKSDLSGRREIIKLLGRSQLDYPEKMRATSEGDWATEQGQKGWLESQIKQIIPSGDKAVAEVLKNFSRVGLGQEEITSLRENVERIRKILPQIQLQEQSDKGKTS